MKHSENFEL